MRCVGFLCFGAVTLASCSKTEEGPEPIEPDVVGCERDAIESEAQAVAIKADMAQQGFICPVEDVDWYRYEVPASHSVLSFKLKMAAPLSPVAPNYSIWREQEGGALGALVAQPEASGIGQAFSDSHCVTPGPLLIKVHDDGDDAQDVRYRYALEISSREDLDEQEPNNSREQRTTLKPNEPLTAAISCQGDEDWYAVTLPEGSLLRVTLQSEVAGYEPTLRILSEDGTQLVEESNPSGSVTATLFERFEVLNGAGDYALVVSDDDNEQADAAVPYTIEVEVVRDNDDNEPNNEPAQATPLISSPVGCASASSEFVVQGSVGAASDQDWFELPLQAGCEGAILDASVEVDTTGLSEAERWALQSEFQIALTMVREHAESECATDRECNALQLPCEHDNACAGYFETCLPEGLCAGASVCLPSGRCGANRVLRRYECNPRLADCKPGAPRGAPLMRAEMSAPLPAGSIVYLNVNDFQSDRAAPDLPYTLRVKIRPDSDQAEPSNLFTNELPTGGLSSRRHRPFAREMVVHDCTAGDCCGASTWLEGALAYENDLDWFRYTHPCPGEDCTLRMRYEVDAGPVDYVINLYRDDSLWFTAFDNEEQLMQPSKQGTLGGLTAADTCFYAFQGHKAGSEDDPYSYYIVVRDLLELYEDSKAGQGIPVPQSRDWSGSQRYRLCVEKIADVCATPPCQIYDDGCGQPQ